MLLSSTSAYICTAATPSAVGSDNHCALHLVLSQPHLCRLPCHHRLQTVTSQIGRLIQASAFVPVATGASLHICCLSFVCIQKPTSHEFHSHPFLFMPQEHLASTQEANAANGHVSATAAGTAADVSRCTARLSAGLSRLQQYIQQQLQPSVAYQGCVLPGHVLSAAALLLGESCCWLELCLEVSKCDRRAVA
jgi:hypothetical protein